MKNHSDNIEERLIPYIEGVLNAREQSEVAAALEADPKLAREVQDLREVISDLQEAFASGVKPAEEELTAEEVVMLASHQGSLKSMKGTSEQKCRLFSNDQALQEYELLRSLTEEMKRTTMAMEDAPPMPEALRAEFQALKASPRPQEQEPTASVTNLTLWKRASLYFESIDPRPLMATAAALAVISLGIHSFNKSSDSTASTEQGSLVSVASPATEEDSTSTGRQATFAGEPSGVTVFTSDDRDLLKAQAEKLLAKKVRYTVTEDRILVAEKELASARAVLWGEEEATHVAVAEEKQEESSLRTQNEKPERLEDKVSSNPLPELDSDGLSTPVTRYDLRSSRPVEAEGEALSDDSDDSSDVPQSPSTKEKSAPQWTQSKPAEEKKTARSADEGTGTASAGVPPEESSSYQENRRQKLRDLALGQTGEKDGERPTERSEAPTPAPAPAQVDLGDFTQIGLEEEEPSKTTLTRARSAPSPSETAVPNVVTAKSAGKQDEGTASTKPGGGSVATRGAEPPSYQAATRPTATSRVPTRSSSAIRVEPPAEASADSEKQAEGSDLRLAGVLRSQAEVARRYNVILSVESEGAGIKVYVRPKDELSKSEVDELRRAIRSDLGLSSEDSIIFR